VKLQIVDCRLQVRAQSEVVQSAICNLDS